MHEAAPVNGLFGDVARQQRTCRGQRDAPETADARSVDPEDEGRLAMVNTRAHARTHSAASLYFPY